MTAQRIRSVQVFPVDGGWDPWTFLKITTEDGAAGWSEFSRARGRRGLPQVVENMAELVIGADALRPARVSARLRSQLLAPAEGLQAMAIGAIENACLDLAARVAGLPIHAMLGGALRDSVPVYWSHCGLYRMRHAEMFETLIGAPAVRGLDDIVALGREVRARGYGALKTNLLDLRPAGSKSIVRNPDPAGTLPESWITGLAVDLMSAFRQGAGADVGLMLDLNFNFRPEGMRRLARALAPLDLEWLEIDCPDAAQLAAIRAACPIPVASLETLLTRRQMRPYLDAQAVDVAIIDPVYCGLLEALQMAALADAHEVNVAAHNSHGPLGTLIAATFCALTPNLRYLEFDHDAVPWRGDLLSRAISPRDGRAEIPQGPGWGADVVESALLPVRHHH